MNKDDYFIKFTDINNDEISFNMEFKIWHFELEGGNYKIKLLGNENEIHEFIVDKNEYLKFLFKLKEFKINNKIDKNIKNNIIKKEKCLQQEKEQYKKNKIQQLYDEKANAKYCVWLFMIILISIIVIVAFTID